MRSNSFVAIKIGTVEPELLDEIAKGIVALSSKIKPVVVHGGGAEIDKWMKYAGKKPKFVDGHRVTDEETMEIAQMVLIGCINQRIVSSIHKHGGKAISLSGMTGNLLRARRIAGLGLVGEIESVSPEILITLAKERYIPVISPVSSDKDGNTLNVNADLVAGSVASALKAKRLIFLTDSPGILKDISDPSSLMPEISANDIDQIKSFLKGGMLPKVESCVKAIEAGVERAHIIEAGKLMDLIKGKRVGTTIHV